MLTYHHTYHNHIQNIYGKYEKICAVLGHIVMLIDHHTDHNTIFHHHSWINMHCLISCSIFDLSSHSSRQLSPKGLVSEIHNLSRLSTALLCVLNLCCLCDHVHKSNIARLFNNITKVDF